MEGIKIFGKTMRQSKLMELVCEKGRPDRSLESPHLEVEVYHKSTKGTSPLDHQLKMPPVTFVGY